MCRTEFEFFMRWHYVECVQSDLSIINSPMNRIVNWSNFHFYRKSFSFLTANTQKHTHEFKAFAAVLSVGYKELDNYKI